jgi:hypothetical protein
VFHVYVDGVTGTGPEARRRVADIMSARYGLPAAELYARLGKGRFRVKANVDHATAHAYARDLEAVGVRVDIEEARPSAQAIPDAPLSRNSAVSLPPPRGSRPAASSLPPRLAGLPSPPRAARRASTAPAAQVGARCAASSLPPQPAQRWSVPSLPPLASGPTSPRQETVDTVVWSGEAAAGASRPIELGALDQSGLLALISLDDNAASESTAPRAAHRPSATPTRPGKAVRSSDPPIGSRIGAPTAGPAGSSPGPAIDRFAPPAHELTLATVELAPDEIEHRARRRMSAPPPEVAALRALASPSTPLAPQPRTRAAPSSERARGAPPVPTAPQPRRSGPPGHGPIGYPAIHRPTDHPVPDLLPPAYLAPEHLAPEYLAPEDLEPDLDPDPSAPAQPSSGPSSGAAPRGAASPSVAPDPRSHRASAPPGSPRLTLRPAPELPAAEPEGTRVKPRVLQSLRVRFAAGVALAIVVGFVPADLVASFQERSAFREIDARVAAVQAAVDSPQSYAALDAFRADQLDAKRDARRSIVVTAMLLWAATGGGLAYVWFKRVRWNRPR